MSPMPVATALGDVRRIAHGPMRRLFVGQAFNALGSGLTLALLMIYLTKVRDLAVPLATGLLAWQAILALLVSPFAGTLIDRFGPRPILMAAALVEAVGIFGYGQVTTAQQAFLTMTVVAIGGAGIWGSASALTARLVPSADRSTAFGFSFMLTNLGLGLGGLIGASIVDVHRPGTFTLLYTLTATAYVGLFLAVLSMGNVGGLPLDARSGSAPETAADDAAGPTTLVPAAGGWRDVLRDRSLLRYALAGLLMLTFGYGSIDAGVGLYVVGPLELKASVTGVVFAANTAVIVFAQLFVLGLIRGRSRARMLAAVGLLWACSWLLFALALGMPVDWAKILVLMVAMGVFAFGETLWSPVAPALLNDLAPEHLRGRYNAFQSVLWGVSGALGPVIAGIFLSANRGLLWALALALGCTVAALIALQLRQHLTADQDGIAEPVEVGS